MLCFEGMMAPTFTPMKRDGSLNLELVPSYAEYLASKGVTGVYVAGTAGEGISLTVPERKLLTEAWANASRKHQLQVIAMVGAAGIMDSQELAKHAESIGVSGIATLPCLYDKPTTVEDLVDYCSDVASAAPNTPFFYYHIPFKTDVNLPMDEFLRKGEAKIKTLAGMKFTSLDVAQEGLRCLKVSQGKFTIFSGFDGCLCEALLLGYKGAINCCFNFLSDDAREIFRLVEAAQSATPGVEKEGLRSEARDQQDRINQILDTIFAFTGGFSVSSAKVAMTLLTGIDVGPPRKPLKPLSLDAVESMSRKLASVMKA